MSKLGKYITQLNGDKPILATVLGDLECYCRKMTVADGDLRASLLSNIKENPDATAILLGLMICDKDGNLIFDIENQEDIADLKQVRMADFRKIESVFNEINGFNEENDDKKKK